MTKKDFQIIANGILAQVNECIADRKAIIDDRDNMAEGFYQQCVANVQVRINMLDRLADGYATTFAQGNERFDRTRFIAACGL